VRILALAVVALLSGCATAQYRAVMLEETEDGGSMITPIEDDLPPGDRFSENDAKQQMAAHCAPRGYKITKRSKFETGDSTHTYIGFGITSSQREWVTRLDYVCVP
jgi:hypothetical protein